MILPMFLPGSHTESTESAPKFLKVQIPTFKESWFKADEIDGHFEKIINMSRCQNITESNIGGYVCIETVDEYFTVKGTLSDILKALNS